MDKDKKRPNRKLQRAARERMRKTGESYTTARMRILEIWRKEKESSDVSSS